MGAGGRRGRAASAVRGEKVLWCGPGPRRKMSTRSRSLGLGQSECDGEAPGIMVAASSMSSVVEECRARPKSAASQQGWQLVCRRAVGTLVDGTRSARGCVGRPAVSCPWRGMAASFRWGVGRDRCCFIFLRCHVGACCVSLSRSRTTPVAQMHMPAHTVWSYGMPLWRSASLYMCTRVCACLAPVWASCWHTARMSQI